MLGRQLPLAKPGALVAKLRAARRYTVSAAVRASSGNGAAAEQLFQPYQLGEHTLKHRVVLAPMTRDRAVGNVPQPNMKTYYSQRATDGGLVITEGTIVSPYGHGYFDVPGIYTKEQVEAWKPITQAVHDKGAVVFMQIWHTGRASLPEFQPDGRLPVSSTASRVITENLCFSMQEMAFVPYQRPRALEIDEIPGIVDEFRFAAYNAIQAGCDGVEIHGANGYLIDQFLKDEINDRTDAYGGAIENRVRFCLEVVDACCAQIGSQRVGLRLSPFGGFLNAKDSHPYALMAYLLEELNSRNLAYVHMVEPSIGGNADIVVEGDSLAPFRALYKNTFIAAGGYQRASAVQAVQSGHADLIAFGRPFIANPDLVARLQMDAPLAAGDPATYYAPGDKGYIDYPSMAEAEAVKA